MPIYEYECSACKNRFERSQRFSDPPVSECPECGGAVRRVLFPAGIVFKGSGWYITDSRKSGSGEPSATAPSSDGAKTGATGEGAAKSDGAAAKSTTAKSEAASSSTSSSPAVKS
jgi:putative FmdB family regulatory protein